MQSSADSIGNGGFIASLGLSLAVVIDSVVKVLDEHSWVIGVIGILISTFIQIHYKRKALELIIEVGDRRKSAKDQI